MNINFNAAFEKGMSEEEIIAAIDNAAKEAKEKAIAEAKAAVEAKKIKDQAKEKIQKTEALKAEGRAYLLNAIIAYSQAYGVMEEEDLDPEEIEKYEKLLIKFEEMVPVYMKLAQIQDEIDKHFGFGFGLGGIV